MSQRPLTDEERNARFRRLPLWAQELISEYESDRDAAQIRYREQASKLQALLEERHPGSPWYVDTHVRAQPRDVWAETIPMRLPPDADLRVEVDGGNLWIKRTSRGIEVSGMGDHRRELVTKPVVGNVLRVQFDNPEVLQVQSLTAIEASPHADTKSLQEESNE